MTAIIGVHRYVSPAVPQLRSEFGPNCLLAFDRHHVPVNVRPPAGSCTPGAALWMEDFTAAHGRWGHGERLSRGRAAARRGREHANRHHGRSGEVRRVDGDAGADWR